MKKIFILLAVLMVAATIPAALMAQAISWEQRLIDEVNLYRLAATLEDGIYREPYTLVASISDSEELWAKALKGTGILAHGAATTPAGYVIGADGRAGKVWVPSRDGWTDFLIRNAFFGMLPALQSENGYAGQSTDPAFVCAAWATSPGHYQNMVDPRFTRAGAASWTWGSGAKSVWLGVMTND